MVVHGYVWEVGGQCILFTVAVELRNVTWIKENKK